MNSWPNFPLCPTLFEKRVKVDEGGEERRGCKENVTFHAAVNSYCSPSAGTGLHPTPKKTWDAELGPVPTPHLTSISRCIDESSQCQLEIAKHFGLCHHVRNQNASVY